MRTRDCSTRCGSRMGTVPSRRARRGGVERVGAIRDLLETGFTVEEVLSLAGCLQGSGDARCGARTAALYRRKLVKIEEQLATLTRLRTRIQEQIGRAHV